MEPNTTVLPAANPPGIPQQSGPRAVQTLTSDFETFLKMLTAQARYQDPLEPIDSTEYASQLAQFSMVEQQVQTNDTLASLFSQMGVQNAASLSAWVGMEARAVTPAFYDGSAITLSPQPAPHADQVVLLVLDETGKEVQRQPLATSDEPLNWAGLASDGTSLPHGIYSFEIESHANGKLLQTDPVAVYSRVSEAQIDGNTVTLILPGGLSVPTNAVTALRDPT